jgi:hypothetical protein
MSSYWWIDRTLPGIVASLIITAAIAASHVLLKRHVNRTTERQNAHIEQLTATQTATLSGQRKEEGAG